ncbi:MAG: TetR family transcriptional regulator C-terminal domain-containing protein [SAR324 cluster bacterium]|nr:TetR family transcriptional regulator C-terminal domain-containing protein [SAR324 cluster bacterium]MBL7034565.1 TetR family transcriptional regulator C-terminal domain-containing protein [SAR324 cluster bacterium]
MKNKKKQISQKLQVREDNERRIMAAAEIIFAEQGYKGSTTKRIAELAGIPKANLHYYFSTKEELYRRVLDDILQEWLHAADTFDDSDDPVKALTDYIHAKMNLSRARPNASKIWASEIMQGAPVIQQHLETTLREWIESREVCLQKWVKAGKLRSTNMRSLFYMIWATTQHYADFGHQIKTLNNGEPFSNSQFENAKKEVTEIILRGIGAIK